MGNPFCHNRSLIQKGSYQGVCKGTPLNSFHCAAQAELVLRAVLGASSDPDALYALASQGTADAEEVSGTACIQILPTGCSFYR